LADVRAVQIPLSDGSALPAALAMPSRPSGAGVIVIHEAIGLNDDIRRIAARFADAGYLAVAPDFLAGLGPKPFCIARFAAGIGRVRVGRPYRQLAAAEAWLRARPEVAGGPIGVAGFCMGGGFALLHAAGAGIDVVAPFYPAVPKTDDALTGVCPVVASFGGRDGVFGGGGPRLAETLDRLGVDHDVKTYPNAGHSFVNRHGALMSAIERRLPTHGGHDPVAADDAWTRVLDFFGRHLGATARV
jgi:carboxymethylenebutenolidase